jgi:CHAT domain-containing protein
LSRARAALARLVLQTPGGVTPAVRDARVKELGAEIERLESRLSARTAKLSSNASGISVEELQRAIAPDAALIEFFRYRPFDAEALRSDTRFGPAKYVAYSLKREGTPVWWELGEAEPIDRAIASLRAALKSPDRSDAVARAADLRVVLTEPVQRLAGSVSQLILSPDGDMNLLPFQVLTQKDGAFLLQRYLISYVTSAREIARPADREVASGPPLIVSSPAFGPPRTQAGVMRLRFDPLPGTALESQTLAKLLPGARRLTGAYASEENVKAAKQPRILHVATHGFFLAGESVAGSRMSRGLRMPGGSDQFVPPLLRSGLALAGANSPRAGQRDDGILTAAEAALLDLTGTQLVFLSACETGLGVINAGESVYGLRRAFVIAGAQSQVLTLWQVSDDATRHFVVSFYKHLLGGASRAAALRDAQTEALADAARRHPFYWAAFIVSGESGPVEH